jgi:site-specific DNA-adenine methylase
MVREQNLISRLGNKDNDMKHIKSYFPLDETYNMVIEPFGGSFAVIRNIIAEHSDKKTYYVNDNDEILYAIYSNPEIYKQLLIDANNICLQNLDENVNCVYSNTMPLINALPYDKKMLEYWKQSKIIRGVKIKYNKTGVNVDKSLELMQNINFSSVDWFEYTKEHAKNEKAFIFLDPPYLFSDNSSYSQCKRKENCDVTDILYKVLDIFKHKNTKAKIMLIINNLV